MLELLTGPLLVTVGHGTVVDLLDVRETIDDERAEENGVAHLVTLDRQTHEAGQRLQF